ncbi:MAG: hypothetical protein M3P04_03650 [Actinomycetota bacterium]|nr:hypothetical protein [Actinomycetota bacterium]
MTFTSGDALFEDLHLDAAWFGGDLCCHGNVLVNIRREGCLPVTPVDDRLMMVAWLLKESDLVDRVSSPLFSGLSYFVG